MQLVDAEHPLAQLQVAMERRQVPVHAVDEARVDRQPGCSGRRAPTRARTDTCAPWRRTATFCTSPFIVVPNVRLKPPSALKNADITFSRSARLGSARKIAVARLIELDRPAVAQRDASDTGNRRSRGC